MTVPVYNFNVTYYLTLLAVSGESAAQRDETWIFHYCAGYIREFLRLFDNPPTIRRATLTRMANTRRATDVRPATSSIDQEDHM